MTFPLEGIDILDISRAAAGPYATMLLGDVGAEVVKVERPGTGDEIRYWDEHVEEGMSTYYLGLNRNKRSIEIDLKDEDGQALVRELATEADVFVENYRPGILEDWGLDYETLREENEALIYCSITGFGDSGPLADRAGMDLIAQAYSGIMGITGEQDGPPVKVGPPVSDLGTAIQAAWAITVELLARERTGEGTRIDLSLLEGSLALIANHTTGVLSAGKTVERMGSGHPQLVPYQAFQGSDNEYFVVGILNEKFWDIFCDIMDMEELRDDDRFHSNPKRVQNRDELIPILEAAFEERPAAEWLEMFGREDVPCAPILDLKEALDHDQLDHLEVIAELTDMDGQSINSVGTPYRTADRPRMRKNYPPHLGEHTDEVLHEYGFSQERIDQLRERNAIGHTDQ